LVTSPLFFRIVTKLVQAFVIAYNEIFQALAVGDVLFSTSGHALSQCYQMEITDLEVLSKFIRHVEVQGHQAGAV
jgi:hypothetical protein